jgi:hypothetical protein
MCGNAIAKESETYNEKIRTHMVKIQKFHGFHVENVAKYILRFSESDTRYRVVTLGWWAKAICFFGMLVPQPRYQKMIGRLYKSV